MTSWRVLLRTGRRLEYEGFVVDGPGEQARRIAAEVLGAPVDLVVLAVRA